MNLRRLWKLCEFPKQNDETLLFQIILGKVSTKGAVVYNSPDKVREVFMKNNKGFSLVELIVVIAIMAILAAVAVVSFSVYIEHAHDASDQDFISNVLYRVKLFTVEKGVEVQQVVISPKVDDADDIQLIIGWDDNGQPIYYEGEDRDEIYETVGNYTMYGEYLPNDMIVKPIIPGGVISGGGGGGDNHEHKLKLLEHKASTCVEYGYDKYQCEIDGCEYIETIYASTLGNHNEDKVGGTDEYEIHQCQDCGNLVIKSTSGNAIVALPKDE